MTRRLAFHLRECRGPDYWQRQICHATADGAHGYERRKNSWSKAGRPKRSARRSGVQLWPIKSNRELSPTQNPRAKSARQSCFGTWRERPGSSPAGGAATIRRMPRILRRTRRRGQPNPERSGRSPNPTNAVGTPAGPGGINTNLNNQSLAALAALKPTGPVDGPCSAHFSPALRAASISLRSGYTTAEKNTISGSSSGIPSKIRPKRSSKD